MYISSLYSIYKLKITLCDISPSIINLYINQYTYPKKINTKKIIN